MGLYEQIVHISEDYLGPAGQRFIDRQIVFHLNKYPQDLKKEDVPKLVEWVKVTLGLFADDANKIEECSTRILKLAN